VRHIEPRARAGRLKQWLNYLRRCHPQAEAAYAAVRTINDPQRVAEQLGLAPPRADAHGEEELLECGLEDLEHRDSTRQGDEQQQRPDPRASRRAGPAAAGRDEGVPTTLLSLSEDNARVLMLLLKAQLAEFDSRKRRAGVDPSLAPGPRLGLARALDQEVDHGHGLLQAAGLGGRGAVAAAHHHGGTLSSL